MSSCLSGGGGRAYALELELLKSPSPISPPTTTRASNNASSSSSPSSTLSDSINSVSALTITTRKPRTPRKRPNQTYNEAAALLSTAYPSLFPKLPKSPNHTSSNLSDDSSESLFFPLRSVADDYSSTFLLLPDRLTAKFRPKLSSCAAVASPGEIESRQNCSDETELSCGVEQDNFDAESMLDEEVYEGGIDSIMGNLSVKSLETSHVMTSAMSCYGYPMGLGIGIGIGRRGVGVRAMRHVDEGNWWSFPAVDMVELSPRLRKPVTEKKKKMKKVERERVEVEKEEAGLLLKLNYDGVLDAWSDKGSPFSEETTLDGRGNDVAVGVLNSARKIKCRKDNDKRKK